MHNPIASLVRLLKRAPDDGPALPPVVCSHPEWFEEELSNDDGGSGLLPVARLACRSCEAHAWRYANGRVTWVQPFVNRDDGWGCEGRRKLGIARGRVKSQAVLAETALPRGCPDLIALREQSAANELRLNGRIDELAKSLQDACVVQAETSFRLQHALATVAALRRFIAKIEWAGGIGHRCPGCAAVPYVAQLPDGSKTPVLEHVPGCGFIAATTTDVGSELLERLRTYEEREANGDSPLPG